MFWVTLFSQYQESFPVYKATAEHWSHVYAGSDHRVSATFQYHMFYDFSRGILSQQCCISDSYDQEYLLTNHSPAPRVWGNVETAARHGRWGGNVDFHFFLDLKSKRGGPEIEAHGSCSTCPYYRVRQGWRYHPVVGTFRKRLKPFSTKCDQWIFLITWKTSSNEIGYKDTVGFLM